MPHMATGLECKYLDDRVQVIFLTKTARGTTVRFDSCSLPSGRENAAERALALAASIKKALPER